MRTWLQALAALAVFAWGLTAVDGWYSRPETVTRAVHFQHLTGGLGMGDTSAVYWDFATFDPRLEPNCACTLWPVPGGFLFSPEHTATVWDPPEVLLPERVRMHRGAGESR